MRAGSLSLATLLLLLSAFSVAAGDGETFHVERAEVGAFPREIPANGTITFPVRLKRGYRTPVLSVTHPDGGTEYLRPTRTLTSQKFEFDVGFKAGRGAYRVELVVDSARGDTTAAQFTIWAGVHRPEKTGDYDERRPESEYEREPADESTIRLERKFFRLINGYREEQRLEPYPWLEQAAVLAREHLTDYLALDPRPKKLTHLIPGEGSIADRFQDVFHWPRTIRKFPIAEPEIGPEAICYCSESLASVRSLDWLFEQYFLKESAFRAPIVSEFPTHAAVGVVRNEKTGRLFTAAVFVQVNSTRIQKGLRRELDDLEKAESRARDEGSRAAAIRALARFGAEESVRRFERRLSDRSEKVRAAALDALFLNDLDAAMAWVERGHRILARAHDRERYALAIPVLRTFAAVLFDARVRARGLSELAQLEMSSEAELNGALVLAFSGKEGARDALEEIARRYPGLPAAETAEARLEEMDSDGNGESR